VSSVVLAGGKSLRMGRNKAELVYNSMTLINLQVKKLANLGINDLMISGYSRSIPGTRFIPDMYGGRGPLSGIHASLARSLNSSCLVISVDTPLIPSELLMKLIETHESNETPITIASHQGAIEPLIGVYSCTLVPLIERILLSGENVSIRSVLNMVPYAVYSYEGNDSVFLNCNTPEDYINLMKH
jgi:molybdopterin-guanine dinucleotide biosynthesis protein A